ncbi:MAG: D-alanyl-D-alanine carboxypeptidase [Ruminococcaceae bacterium]|nr:D-alanyl-D-alanine carboxypeptidase [Oscillospiraceae bacterium]
MKKLIFAIIIALCAFSIGEVTAYSDGISAKSAIVYEPLSKTVLYEKSADEQMLVASTTKIMTALIVIENCSLDEKVEVNSGHSSVEGSSMYLRPDGEYTVEDLLYGLMLASGNDAAAALADHAAGSMESFAELMNEKCRELSLENTHFVNAHGLDAQEHYSSARDLAIITAAAMENETFCHVFSCRSYTVDGNTFYNHNKLLDTCSGCIGGKTGFTKKAGRVLVSCVERSGMRLICVTISAPDDWNDHISLYEQCFDEYDFVPISNSEFHIPVISGVEEAVCLSFEMPGVVVPKNLSSELEFHLPRFVFAPIEAGERAGYAELISGGNTVEKVDIYFGESVSRRQK